jgi:anti-sigma factor RsiW
MKCPSIEKLIPLFVEGDLSPGQTKKVRGHVDGCQACRTLVDDYRTSQRWLHGAPPLQVGGATLEGLRRSVWKRIASEPATPALRRHIEWAWASLRHWAAQPAMATLALFVVVTGSYALSRVTTSPGPASRFSLEAPAAANHGDERSREPMLARATLDDGSDDLEPGTGDDSVASDDSMRIEIQTRDPDVRIIWFSPTEDRAPAVED